MNNNHAFNELLGVDWGGVVGVKLNNSFQIDLSYGKTMFAELPTSQILINRPPDHTWGCFVKVGLINRPPDCRITNNHQKCQVSLVASCMGIRPTTLTNLTNNEKSHNRVKESAANQHWPIANHPDSSITGHKSIRKSRQRVIFSEKKNAVPILKLPSFGRDPLI